MSYARNLNDSNKNHTVLAKAIKKYGEENFFVEEVEKVSIEMLDEREIYYISLYNSHVSKSGYNVSAGGRYGVKNLSFSNEEMLEVYHRTKSCRKTGEYFSVDKETISNRLNRVGVPLYSLRDLKGINILVETPLGKTLQFNSKMSAAEWFIENNIPQSNKVDCVRRRIRNGVYYGYKITLLQ